MNASVVVKHFKHVLCNFQYMSFVKFYHFLTVLDRMACSISIFCACLKRDMYIVFCMLLHDYLVLILPDCILYSALSDGFPRNQHLPFPLKASASIFFQQEGSPSHKMRNNLGLTNLFLFP